jgi:hypothetical protein
LQFVDFKGVGQKSCTFRIITALWKPIKLGVVFPLLSWFSNMMSFLIHCRLQFKCVQNFRSLGYRDRDNGKS